MGLVKPAGEHPPEVSILSVVSWLCCGACQPAHSSPLCREFLFRHPKRTATLSMRNTSVMKKGGVFSAEFLKVFLPSLLLSHLLAIGLG